MYSFFRCKKFCAFGETMATSLWLRWDRGTMNGLWTTNSDFFVGLEQNNQAESESIFDTLSLAEWVSRCGVPISEPRQQQKEWVMNSRHFLRSWNNSVASKAADLRNTQVWFVIVFGILWRFVTSRLFAMGITTSCESCSFESFDYTGIKEN